MLHATLFTVNKLNFVLYLQVFVEIHRHIKFSYHGILIEYLRIIWFELIWFTPTLFFD